MQNKIDIDAFKKQMPGSMYTLKILYTNLLDAMQTKPHLVMGMNSAFIFHCCHLIEILLKACIQLEGKSYSTGHTLSDYYDQLSEPTQKHLEFLYEESLRSNSFEFSGEKTNYYELLSNPVQSPNSLPDSVEWTNYYSYLKQLNPVNVIARYPFEKDKNYWCVPQVLFLLTQTTHQITTHILHKAKQ